MLQTLFHIPAEIAGYPVFGPGLLLAVWALVSLAVMIWIVRRQGFVADTWNQLIILLLIGGAIRFVLPAISEPEGLPIRGYGMMILLGVVAGASLAVRRAKRIGIDPDTIFSLAFWMLLPGIIGARAFYVIEYWKDYVQVYHDPNGGLGPFLGNVINLTRGGLVVYGSFFGAVAGLLFFIRRYKLSLLKICDVIAPCMMLGLALGRVGCLLNGCCFGEVCDYPWAITFPASAPSYYAQVQRGQMYGFTISGNPDAKPLVMAVRHGSPADKAGMKSGDTLKTINGYKLSSAGQAHAALLEAFGQEHALHIEILNKPAVTLATVSPPPRSLPVHPTQIYSVIDGLAICLVLLTYERIRRRRRDGEVFALLMSIYPITRFCIESLRTDEAAIFGTGMSIAQNVSLLLLLCAAALWFYIFRRETIKNAS